MNRLLLFIFIALIYSCSSSKKLYERVDSTDKLDYSNLKYWAAHPAKIDFSDSLPNGITKSEYPQVDVFFVHPTTYTSYRGKIYWNADINDEKLNLKTDKSSILFQSTIFNENARVFAPRYRQTHIKAFFTKDIKNANKAFDLAYSDVKAAFEQYMKYENNGRPIIIAGHSQGMKHAAHLLLDFFDGKPLQQKLVAAYIIGLPLTADYFKNIKPCESPEDLNCVCSWRTYKSGKYPKFHIPNNNIIVTNPLSWKRDNKFVDKLENKQSILRNFTVPVDHVCDAQCHDGLLWANLHFKGSRFILNPNYHIGDFNLFWGSVRKNVKLRTDKYLKQLD